MATKEDVIQDLIQNDARQEAMHEESPLLPKNDIENKLRVINTSEKNNLQKITISKEIFDQIKKSLQATVSSMEKNPSIISRAAEYWGQLPLWQKIIGGITLTLPTLILGIAAHIGFLLAICGVTTITYAAGSIILDDHHNCSNSTVENLQKGVLGLANYLELTITALDAIRGDLALEINKFVDENARLNASIEAISKQIDAIDRQVLATSQVNTALGETKDGLVAISDLLQIGVAMNGNLLQQNQDKLDRITNSYIGTQKELAEKVLEIQQVRSELGADMTRAKGMIDTLHATISQLSTSSIGNEEQRKVFQEKLDGFIANKESSFLLIADRICEAERKLAIVQKELDSSNIRYRQLLTIQEQQIDMLKGMNTHSPAPLVPMSELLSKNGLYATAPTVTSDAEEPALSLENK